MLAINNDGGGQNDSDQRVEKSKKIHYIMTNNTVIKTTHIGQPCYYDVLRSIVN